MTCFYQNVFIEFFFTEISNFDVEPLIKQKIFWFQISMDDVVTMAVFNSGHDLLEEPTGTAFGQLKPNVSR